MAVILPDGHPAIENLRQEGCKNVIPASQAPKDNVVRVAVANTMSNVVETETQFARAFAESGLNVELVFYSPSTKIAAAHEKSDSKKEQHRLKYHKPLSEIRNDKTINGIVLTGFPGANLDLRQKTGSTDDKGNEFYNEFIDLLDYARKSNTPTLATCWAAHVALNHFYGIERLKREAKLTGIFELAVTNANSPLVKGIEHKFPMPVSRYYYSDEIALRAQPNLNILASSEETGAAIVSEKKGPFIYMSGHLEYLANTLLKELLRDFQKKGTDAPYPENLDPFYQKRTWAAANTAFYSNLANLFNASRTNKLAAARILQPHRTDDWSYTTQEPAAVYR
ncbi:MAG TPA: homoserine O-succinyltransferase [Alphaproteobacteria bacterium]|nr:homoserine O-succinyltransferase [Alphaproteobacteria bacterium]USO05203.1 MAG: homoserine O-succinyltransferase [Rhodospirillales bacterium]HOO82637.1 homoserine O-succinyltransferase [Alphaproteobacteria bacterium]